MEEARESGVRAQASGKAVLGEEVVKN